MCCISENTYHNLLGVYLDFVRQYLICKLNDAYMSLLRGSDVEGGMPHVLPEIRTVTLLRRIAAMLNLKPDT